MGAELTEGFVLSWPDGAPVQNSLQGGAGPGPVDRRSILSAADRKWLLLSRSVSRPKL
jgi:hypothetical protein